MLPKWKEVRNSHRTEKAKATEASGAPSAKTATDICKNSKSSLAVCQYFFPTANKLIFRL